MNGKLVNPGEEFVAVPLGKGVTVERQLTGSEVGILLILVLSIDPG